MEGIIDNREKKLSHVLKQSLRYEGVKRLRVAVGYFLLSGVRELLPELQEFIQRGGQLDILMGNYVSRQTYEDLSQLHKNSDFTRDNLPTTITQNERSALHTEIENDADKQVLLMSPTVENENLIAFLRSALSSGQLRIRVYPRERFHAKAYVVEGEESDSLLTPDLAGVVGSSNFSLSGLNSNTELNATVYTQDAQSLSQWYQARWEDSDDLSDAFLRVFDDSWIAYAPGKLPAPYQVYLKSVFELYRDALQTTEEMLRTYQVYGDLFEFQKWAVLRATDIVTNYGGVIIGDVTGTGKTFIGASLLEHFYHRNLSLGQRGRALIVCPPKLRRNWEMVRSHYSLNADIVSIGMLSQPGYEQEMLERYQEASVVLIDESHHFRNHDNQRYATLRRFLASRESDVIMLSATPYSKGAKDIYNQLKLFHQQDLTSIPITPPNLNEFTKMVNNDQASLTELLTHIMVRRTRHDLLSEYGAKDDDGRWYFEVENERRYLPQRKLKTVNYEIEKVYQREVGDDFYQTIVETLESLNYTRYSLGAKKYLKPEYRKLNRYQQLSQAGRNIRGLIKSLLLKRLESSIYAFRESLNRIVQSHDVFASFLAEDRVVAGDILNHLLELDIEDFDVIDQLEAALANDDAEEYDIDAFNVDSLKEDIEHDRNELKSLLESVNKILDIIEENYQKDNKLVELSDVIGRIRAGSYEVMEEPAQRILVFSQYADTVHHVYEGLRHLQESGYLNRGIRIAQVTSGSGNADVIAERFAPQANNAAYKYQEDDFIDVLIATDVMGEGLNLQDANAVVNYDLHWNPLRIIQRIGRLDRIGSDHQYIYVLNFLPETSLEEKLNIVSKVEERVNEFNTVLGGDGKILKEDEKPNPSFMKNVYQEDVESLEEAERKYLFGEDEISLAVTKLRRELSENSELERQLERMDGVRSAKEWDHEQDAVFVVCKSGEYVTPYLVSFGSEEPQLSAQSGKEHLLQLIQCEPDEGVAEVDSDTFRDRYAQASKLALNEFHKELQQRLNVEKPKATKAQRYVVGELQKLLRWETDEKRKSALKHHVNIVGSTSLDLAIDEFRNLESNGIEGERLFFAVRDIIAKYNLESHQKRRKELQNRLREAPHIVCGMYLKGASTQVE